MVVIIIDIEYTIVALEWLYFNDSLRKAREKTREGDVLG